MNFLRRLTHSRVIRGGAKKLHLDPILRPTYRWWTSLRRVVKFRTMGLSYKMRLDSQELREREWEIDYGERDFLEVLAQAGRDVHRNIRVMENRTQAKDHPILLGVPETSYLKCIIASVSY